MNKNLCNNRHSLLQNKTLVLTRTPTHRCIIIKYSWLNKIKVEMLNRLTIICVHVHNLNMMFWGYYYLQYIVPTHNFMYMYIYIHIFIYFIVLLLSNNSIKFLSLYLYTSHTCIIHYIHTFTLWLYQCHLSLCKFIYDIYLPFLFFKW